MDRINRILNHPQYKYYCNQIKAYEKERAYCKHDISHFLDVARIAYIEVLEKGYEVDKETLYAAALLHDIGRYEEYITGEEHNLVSHRLCEPILEDTGFNATEKRHIKEAILNHRNSKIKEDINLNGIIYRADKSSRKCFACEKIDQCNWDKKKKNMGINR